MLGDKWKRAVQAVSHANRPERKGWSRKSKFGSQNSIDSSLGKYVEHLEADQEVWEKEKTELKSRVQELEEFQEKYEQEKKENEILQNRLRELMVGQSDTTQNLMRANESLDRLRLDQKKKVEQIEKMQRDISIRDDRIRNLEIRASEVEKAELILETTKQNLEQSQTQVKVRDSEITKLNKELDDCNRQIDIANKRIHDLEEKIEDMKLQVRTEIMKNENIEKNLETIPRLKDTIEEKEREIEELKKHIDDKNALLTAARKAVREYKDKVRNTEQQLSQTEMLKEDLQLSQCEILSLKRLMCGKDYLVTQKTKALDLSKDIISVLNDSLENEHVERIQHLINRLSGADHTTRTNSSRSYGSQSMPSDLDIRSSSAPPPRFRSSTPGPGIPAPGAYYTKDIDINTPPYSVETSSGHSNQNNQVVANGNHSHGNKRILTQVAEETPDKRQRPVSAVQPSGSRRSASAVHRTTSYKEARKVYTQPLPRRPNEFEGIYVQSPRQNSYKSDSKHSSSKLKPSLDYRLGEDDLLNNNEKCVTNANCSQTRNSESARLQTALETDSASSSSSDLDDDLTPDGADLLRHMSGQERDALLEEVINLGDRVLISCPQKPPRYGKKKVLKPINYTGIVKFKGKLNPDKYDARSHVGVRMDEQVGDTDGMYKGKRFMYTPADQGKFFKLRELTSVLNVKTGRYVPVKRLMVHYLHKQERARQKTEQED